jgi:hypothetical protein
MVMASFGDQLDKKTTKAFEKKKKVLDAHLKADPWWSIKDDIDETLLSRAVDATFKTGIELVRGLVAKTLYEEAKIDSMQAAEPLGRYLGAPAGDSMNDLVDETDRATFNLVKAACMAASCKAFAVPTVYQSIQADATTEDLLRDPDFVAILAGYLKEFIDDIFVSRALLVSDYANRTLVEESITRFFKEIGLKEGDWTYKDGKLLLNEAKLLKISDRKDFLQ